MERGCKSVGGLKAILETVFTFLEQGLLVCLAAVKFVAGVEKHKEKYYAEFESFFIRQKLAILFKDRVDRRAYRTGAEGFLSAHAGIRRRRLALS